MRFVKKVISCLMVPCMMMAFALPAAAEREYDMYDGQLFWETDDTWNAEEIGLYMDTDDGFEVVNAAALDDETGKFHLYYVFDNYGESGSSYADAEEMFYEAGQEILLNVCEGESFTFEGILEGENRDYARVKVDDGELYEYIAEAGERAHVIFEGFTFSDEPYDEEELESVEEMILGLQDEDFLNALKENAEEGMLEDAFDGNEAFGSYEEYEKGYESSDSGMNLDSILIILGIVSVVAAPLIKSRKKKEEDAVVIREEDPVSGEWEESDEEPGLIQSPASEEVTYQSSASYENSLKDMLKSGIITKKEYKELMKKHGKE